MISAEFVPLKYYTLSSQLRRLTSLSVGLFGSANSVTRSYPVMRKSCIGFKCISTIFGEGESLNFTLEAWAPCHTVGWVSMALGNHHFCVHATHQKLFDCLPMIVVAV